MSIVEPRREYCWSDEPVEEAQKVAKAFQEKMMAEASVLQEDLSKALGRRVTVRVDWSWDRA